MLAFGADFINIIDGAGVQVTVAGDVFQLHDHIAGPGSSGATQWTAPGDPNLKPSHHCELSMSPIGLALAPDTPLLCSSAPIAPAPSIPAPLTDLFVPLSPPRA